MSRLRRTYTGDQSTRSIITSAAQHALFMFIILGGALVWLAITSSSITITY